MFAMQKIIKMGKPLICLISSDDVINDSTEDNRVDARRATLGSRAQGHLLAGPTANFLGFAKQLAVLSK